MAGRLVPLVINSGSKASLVSLGEYQLDGFGIQASFKTRNDTLINVRGDLPEEFDLHLSHVLEKVEQIHAAEAALKGEAPQSNQDAAALIQATMPGTAVIAEHEAPPGAGPAAQSPQQFQQTHCQRCMQSPTCKTCQRPAKVVPRSVKNGQYYIHDCPSGERDHKGSWCNLPK